MFRGRLAENHEHRAARRELDRHGDATISLRVFRGEAARAGHRIPKLGRLARDAECALHRLVLLRAIRDKINVGLIGTTVDEVERNFLVAALELEVGRHTVGQQHLARGLSRNDASPPRRSAPQRVGELLHLRVTFWKTGQSRGLDRFWSDHGRADSHEFLHFAQDGQRNRRAFRQHEHAVAHAVGQRDASVLHGEPRENAHLGDDIVVVTGTNFRRVAAAELREIRNVIAIVIKRVGDRQAALEQELAAVEVAEKRRGFAPPRHVRIQMRAGKILLPRHAHRLGRADERVPDEAVQSLTARVIEGGFEIVPQRLLPVRADGGEALGGDEPSAVGVRGGGGLFYKKTVLVADAVRPRPRPEFRHRHIVHAEASLRVDRNRVRPAGLGMNSQSVPVRERGERRVVFVHRKIAEGLAVIVEETVACRTRINDVPGENRQERQQIVVAPFFELLPKCGRPVVGLDFPTVRVQIFQRLPGQRPGVGEERLDDRVPVSLERALVEDIDRVALPTVARCRDLRAVCHRAAEAHDFPVTLRHIPVQRAVRAELRCEIEHVGGARLLLARLRGNIGEQRRCVGRGKMERLVHRLLRPMLDGTRLRGLRPPRHDEKIAVVFVLVRRHRKRLREFLRPLRARLGPDQLFRRVLGLHHRAAEIPSALDVEAHLQPEPRRLAQRVLVKLAPGRREKSRAVRHLVVSILLRATRVAEERAAETLRLHLHEIADDGFLRHVAIQPPPIRARSRLHWRRCKACIECRCGGWGKFIRRGGAGGDRGEQEYSEGDGSS